MKTQLANIISASRDDNFDKLESTRRRVYGDLADGNVISRIQEILDSTYESASNP
jgi:hypothetical protein